MRDAKDATDVRTPSGLATPMGHQRWKPRLLTRSLTLRATRGLGGCWPPRGSVGHPPLSGHRGPNDLGAGVVEERHHLISICQRLARARCARPPLRVQAMRDGPRWY